MCVEYLRRPEESTDPLELEMQVVKSCDVCAGNCNPGACKTTSSLTHWATSPAPREAASCSGCWLMQRFIASKTADSKWPSGAQPPERILIPTPSRLRRHYWYRNGKAKNQRGSLLSPDMKGLLHLSLWLPARLHKTGLTKTPSWVKRAMDS